MMGMLQARKSRAPRSRFPALMGVALALLLAAGCGGKAGTPSTKRPTAHKTGPSTAPAGGVATPVILTGSGNRDTRSFPLEEGLAVFQIRNSASGNFSATLMDAAGKQVSVLASTANPFNGSTALGVGSGSFKVHVVSNGSWEIDVAQDVPVNPQYTPLFASGDGPLVTPFFRSSGSSATVTMSYAGSASPFVVTLMTSKGATVNEVANQPTGPFSGQKTVPLEQGVVYLIDVEGSGPWTVQVQ